MRQGPDIDGDIKRRAGWLPTEQDDLESWLAGHRDRVEARGEQVVLHPVIVEFQRLIGSDPVVRMYMTQMIAQVPASKPYRKRHLENVEQLLRLINEVLTMAPEFSEGSYHRWHRPVAGTIVRAFVQQGTYPSEADSEGVNAVEPTNSQSYLAHVAARAIILIRANNPVIGLMAVVPVGMVEVSSCIIDPKITLGYHVAKGEELGYFQFGGSTECLIFRPGAIEGFSLAAIPQPHDPQAPLVRVRSQLATASASKKLP
ncbi:phophatidylserine decarboxylase associated domain-containing protein [Cryobacterium sp. GrIS_2_6]|uniref:phophatidylserine decarboxylase associated domain-containing protein n=1 Tax=Cryobacterium sp. GrIS_2_6 TaxID=3162785 RepID=UPI002E05127A|nr:hypothetical protein [Cryobacterium psychrotolerans]